jgi:hypothetical protein
MEAALAYELRFRRWERDGDVRFYLDGRYVDPRLEESGAECVYLRCNEDGSVGWRHGFRTGPDTIRRAERNAWAAKATIEGLKLDQISFAEFERRFQECMTKGGNFSVRQYEKKYLLPAIAA